MEMITVKRKETKLEEMVITLLLHRQLGSSNTISCSTLFTISLHLNFAKHSKLYSNVIQG